MLPPFGLPRPGPSQPDSHPMARHLSLVSQHAERLSRRFLEEHGAIVRDHARGRHGVYALYRGERLYYVGLASDLRSRMKQHLRDTHATSWDGFTCGRRQAIDKSTY